MPWLCVCMVGWLIAGGRLHAGERDTFHIQAHRGAGIDRPENTLETFRWSWERGITPEADLRTTKDSIIVCFHDANFKRVVGGISDAEKAGSIERLPLSEVQKLEVGSFRGKQFSGERIPTLESVFDAMRGHPQRLLYLDVKKVDLDGLARLVEKHEVERQIIFTSPDHRLIREWKKRIPESMTLIWNGGNESELAKKIQSLREAKFNGITHLQVHVRVGDFDSNEPFSPSQDFLTTLDYELGRRGIVFQVLPWECSDPEIYERLLELGVDSFATDYPEVTLQVVKSFRETQTRAVK
jgi:glycerophosphoryl diester phosphodiesterase